MVHESYARGESFDFALPDASAGGERCTGTDLVGAESYLLAVLLRSHYCPFCRELVGDLADGYGGFASRDAAVVAVLPDRPERAAVWHRRYDLPFPILADDAGEAGEFDAFEPFQDLVSRPPVAVLFAVDDGTLRFVRTLGGEGTQSFPSVDELQAAIADERARVGPSASTQADS